MKSIESENRVCIETKDDCVFQHNPFGKQHQGILYAENTLGDAFNKIKITKGDIFDHQV